MTPSLSLRGWRSPGAPTARRPGGGSCPLRTEPSQFLKTLKAPKAHERNFGRKCTAPSTLDSHDQHGLRPLGARPPCHPQRPCHSSGLSEGLFASNTGGRRLLCQQGPRWPRRRSLVSELGLSLLHERCHPFLPVFLVGEAEQRGGHSSSCRPPTRLHMAQVAGDGRKFYRGHPWASGLVLTP